MHGTTCGISKSMFSQWEHQNRSLSVTVVATNLFMEVKRSWKVPTHRDWVDPTAVALCS